MRMTQAVEQLRVGRVDVEDSRRESWDGLSVADLVGVELLTDFSTSVDYRSNAKPPPRIGLALAVGIDQHRW